MGGAYAEGFRHVGNVPAPGGGAVDVSPEPLKCVSVVTALSWGLTALADRIFLSKSYEQHSEHKLDIILTLSDKLSLLMVDKISSAFAASDKEKIVSYGSE